MDQIVITSIETAPNLISINTNISSAIVLPVFSSFQQPGKPQNLIYNTTLSFFVEKTNNLSISFTITADNLDNISKNGFLVFTLDGITWYASSSVYINDNNGKLRTDPVLFMIDQITNILIPSPLNLGTLKVRLGYVRDKTLLSTYIKSSTRIPEILSDEIITFNVLDHLPPISISPALLLPTLFSFEYNGTIFSAYEYFGRSNYNLNTDVLKITFYWPQGSSAPIETYQSGIITYGIFNTFIFTFDDLHWEYDNTPKTDYTLADGTKSVQASTLYIPPFKYSVSNIEDYFTITFSGLGIGDVIKLRIGLIDTISLNTVQNIISSGKIEYKLYPPTDIHIDTENKQRNRVDSNLFTFTLSYADNEIKSFILDTFNPQVSMTPRPSGVKATPAPTPSHTPTPTVSGTSTPTPTVTPTLTPTITVSPTPTLTPTITPTQTPTPTLTPTITPILRNFEK